MAQNSFIQCSDVIKIYGEIASDKQVAALRGLELEVGIGKLVAIIGPSGSGKSTLINILGGIDKPSSGEVIVDGQSLPRMSTKKLVEYHRNKIGILYQLPDKNLIQGLTALENVDLPQKLAGKPRNARRKRSTELLKAVGVERRMKHKPYQLSGGEAQRVGIAVALANKPKLLLADEPTGELDSLNTLKIIDYFKELNKDLGLTMIVVTHDQRFSDMTQETLRIEDGRITGLHRPEVGEDVRKREEVTYIDEYGNLRLPAEIMKAVGIKRHVRLEVIDGKVLIIPVEE